MNTTDTDTTATVDEVVKPRQDRETWVMPDGRHAVLRYDEGEQFADADPSHVARLGLPTHGTREDGRVIVAVADVRRELVKHGARRATVDEIPGAQAKIRRFTEAVAQDRRARADRAATAHEVAQAKAVARRRKAGKAARKARRAGRAR